MPTAADLEDSWRPAPPLAGSNQLPSDANKSSSSSQSDSTTGNPSSDDSSSDDSSDDDSGDEDADDADTGDEGVKTTPDEEDHARGELWFWYLTVVLGWTAEDMIALVSGHAILDPTNTTPVPDGGSMGSSGGEDELVSPFGGCTIDPLLIAIVMAPEHVYNGSHGGGAIDPE
jgi:hypothetical protein